MDVSAFDFSLPPERIALHPTSPRDHARLLVVGPHQSFVDERFYDLEKYVLPGDVLLINNTKVVPARLNGLRVRDARSVEVLLDRPLGEDGVWSVLARPLRRLRAGDRLIFSHEQRGQEETLEAEFLAREGVDGDFARIRFLTDDLFGALERIGVMPLPPYIAKARHVDISDNDDYQTIYAQEKGAVAAPTAGLHFTHDLLGRLEAKGVHLVHVTLHVGAGTFAPVRVLETQEHVMHKEWCSLSERAASVLTKARAQGGRIFCVGTTCVRVLETATDEEGTIRPFQGTTNLFIEPGYRFKACDALITNFHLPRSTLFMLVSAFCGLERMQEAYSYAMRGGYLFYSYGDACLLFPHKED